MKHAAYLALSLSCFLGSSNLAFADVIGYFVGMDERTTIPGGTYGGLANPNFNRLTFLVGHVHVPVTDSHFHNKSGYTYTGPNLGGGTAVQTFPNNNNLPETIGQRIELLSGSGPLSGLYVSGLTPGVDYSDLTMRSVNSLDGFSVGTAERAIFDSGDVGGRYNTTLNSNALQLNVVSITPGFMVVDKDGNVLLDGAGDTLPIGYANSLDFTPIFATANPGALGTFRFTISDLGGTYGQSGEYQINVAAVPEPTSMTLVGLGGLAMAGYRVLRRRAQPQAPVEGVAG